MQAMYDVADCCDNFATLGKSRSNLRKDRERTGGSQSGGLGGHTES